MVQKTGTKSQANQGWIGLVYLVLLSLSIPWYWPKSHPPQIWFGLPDWALVSLIALLGMAAFTVLVIRLRWTDETANVLEDDS